MHHWLDVRWFRGLFSTFYVHVKLRNVKHRILVFIKIQECIGCMMYTWLAWHFAISSSLKWKLSSSHYQSWYIINQAVGNKFHWTLNRKTIIQCAIVHFVAAQCAEAVGDYYTSIFHSFISESGFIISACVMAHVVYHVKDDIKYNHNG